MGRALLPGDVTIDPVAFDEELHGHSAVEMDGTCHAVVTRYDDDGYRSEVTECGLAVSAASTAPETGPRQTFVGERVEMCDDCWPATVVA